jgi:hypothetical protein
MSSFKWYRALCGGIWYCNRYKANGTMFIWERIQGNNTGGDSYNVDVEDYTKTK